jgi:hypothetical protein
MSNKYKTDYLSGELRRFRRGVELQRAAERLAWRAPWPPRPPPSTANAEAADTLILRATIAAAIRKGNAP